MTKVKQYCAGLSYKALMDDNLLLDIRENDEFNKVKFDVPYLIHIPYSEIEKRYGEIPKDKPIIVASSYGKNGEKAAIMLLNNGFENVSNLEEGLSKWLYKRYPVLGDKFFELRQE